MATKAKKLNRYPAHTVRIISVAAECCPATVNKYLAGEKVQEMAAMRIERALVAHGLSHEPNTGGK